MVYRLLLVVAASAALLVLVGGAAHAATTFSVTTTADDATTPPPGSLRAAMLAANATVGADTIDTRGISGTINLTGELPFVGEALDIEGPGSNLLSVRRNTGGDYRILTFNASGPRADDPMRVAGVTIANGHAGTTGAGSVMAQGGGIYAFNPLTLDHVRKFGNTAEARTTGTSSTATAQGAGLFSFGNFRSLTITDSEVSSNSALAVAPGTGAVSATGGGIFNSGNGRALTIDRTTLNDNSALASRNGASRVAGGFGGGIYNDAFFQDSRLTLTNSTLSLNSAGGGAAISNAGTLAVSNSTISDNRADDFGGGIDNFSNDPTVSATTSLNAVTIADNAANLDFDGFGGGGGTQSGSAPPAAINVANTLYYGNVVGATTPTVFLPSQCFGFAHTSGGYNLRTSADAGVCNGFSGPGDLVAGGFALGPLAGGPPATRALTAGSPPVDAGNPAAPGSGGNACPATDERGISRGGSAGRCDIGAYEFGTLPTPPVKLTPPGPTGLRAAALKKCKKKFKKNHNKKKLKKCKKKANKLPA